MSSRIQEAKDLKPCPCCKHRHMSHWESVMDLGPPETDGWYIIHNGEHPNCLLDFGPANDLDLLIVRWNNLPR